jgi:hypothetical protein
MRLGQPVFYALILSYQTVDLPQTREVAFVGGTELVQASCAITLSRPL